MFSSSLKHLTSRTGALLSNPPKPSEEDRVFATSSSSISSTVIVIVFAIGKAYSAHPDHLKREPRERNSEKERRRKGGGVEQKFAPKAKGVDASAWWWW